jgi:parallel beta-helix repeat protein/predicted outer membrane repeat protein
MFNSGAGIEICEETSSLYANKCRFLNNTTIDDNASGGAIDCNGTIYMSSCEVTGNRAGMRGGGVHAENGGRIENCIFSLNTAETSSGGAMYCYDVTLEVVNCTIVNNHADNNGGGIYCCGSSVKTWNCIFRDNTAGIIGPEIYPTTGQNVNYSDIKGGYTGTGNVTEDAKFASANDFHLTPITPACVAVGGTTEGAPSVDHDGVSRSARISMGAYEY